MKPDFDVPIWPTFLKSLDREQLDDLIRHALSEMRSRESEEIKQDFITNSKSLRLQKPILKFEGNESSTA